jgi:hypothetical protein
MLDSIRAMRVDETPVFSVARVTALGSLDTGARDAELLGATVVPWTDLREGDNPFAEVDIRGVLVPPTTELRWLSGDAEVEIIQRPCFADLPESLVSQARPMRSPKDDPNEDDGEQGWPPLIVDSNTLFSAIMGWKDPQISVEIILCALSVAPDDDDGVLRQMLLAGLKARYARVTRQPNVYPPDRYPWHRSLIADLDAILSS